MATTFSVGDRVRIRDWDDMASEFGVDEDGEIPCKYIFAQSMRDFCGQEYDFVWSSDMCEHILSSPNVFVESIEDFV